MHKVPSKNPRPDIENFIKVIKGESIPSKGIVMEYLVDEKIRQEISTELLGLDWVDTSEDKDMQEKYLINYIQFWYRMGYDYVRFESNIGFIGKKRKALDTASLSNGVRQWAEEEKGIVTSWEDFENYKWPQIKDFDFSSYELISQSLPQGMGFIASHGGGVLENVTWLMGYESLSYALYDNPDLVEAIFNKVGQTIYEFYQQIVEIPNIYAFFQGDDMGFKTATLVSPQVLRERVLPWHKKYAELAHKHSMLYLLHSCGNVEAVMEDLIQDVKIDGKHSFEDEIIPVAEFYRKYSNKIAVLGGVDVNVLTTYEEDRLREYIRNILASCMSQGRYALGSGNSIANYIPVKNYLTMVEEGLSWSM
ncbi:hypothetical protein HQ584_10335 [Patescibacteria group bacterium]|nr:hypothetical protein [Patescibacteria group bacterium]